MLAVLVCLLAAASGVSQPAGRAPSLVRSGIAVQVRSATVAPTVELPGEVRATEAGTVVSHYGYWSNILWLASEGSHITKGDKAAVVFAGDVADRAASTSYWLEETEAMASETEAAKALSEAERALTVQQARWDVQEAELELAALRAGPGQAALGSAELDVDRAALEERAAEAALGRLQALDENGGVSHEKLVEAEHLADLARIHQSEAQNALDALKRGPALTDVLAAQAKASQAQAALQAAEDSADADRQKDAADLAAAQAQVAYVRSRWTELDESSRAATRGATASGIVVWPPIYKGGKARPGIASLWATPILRIISPGRVAFVARAGEEEVSRLRVGMEASVRLTGVQTGPLSGRISAIASMSRDLSSWYDYPKNEQPPDTGVPLYEVVVTVDAGEGAGLYQGMAGRATVSTGPQAAQTLVPRACVKAAGGGHWVLARSAGGWTPREVVIGGEDGQFVEVLKGLRPGETVALLEE